MGTIHLRRLASIFVTMAIFLPAAAYACSIPSPGWRASTPVAAEGKPLVFMAISNRNDEPPIDGSTLRIEVLDDSGTPKSGATFIQSARWSRALVVWTPDSAFQSGETYSIGIEGGGQSDPQNVSFEIGVEPISAPDFGTPNVRASRLETASEVTCCQAASDDDRACRKDDCGSYPWGEECNLCRVDAYAYPARVSVDWGTNSWKFRDYFESRLIETTGEETLIEEVRFRGHMLGDVQSERCFVTEYVGLLDDASLPTFRSPEFCVGPDDVEPHNQESQAGIPPSLADRCEPGTYSVGNYQDGFVFVGGPPPRQGEGCQSGGGAHTSLMAIMIAFALMTFRARGFRGVS